MSKFSEKTKSWWSKHKPTKRRLIQIYSALLYNCNIRGFATGRIYTGQTKYMCVPGLNCYSCPGAVGACPLGALQNALAASNTKAPYYVFGILILFGLLLGRTICGFLCPMGLIQDLFYKIPTPKLKKNSITRRFSYVKYVILALLVVSIPLVYSLSLTPVPGFCKYICPSGTMLGAIGLLLNPSNEDMFGMLGGLFTWKFALLVVMIVAAVFIYRFFCRFLCPLGAIYGFFSKIALIGVRLDKNKCTDCGLCINACKMDIKHVGDHECIHCGACISVCPSKAISWKGSKIFVRESEVAVSAEKPLNALMSKTAKATDTSKEAYAPILEQPLNRIEAACIPKAIEQKQEKPPKTRKTRTKRPLKKRREITAWIAAVAVLLGAIVYYNVILPPPSTNVEIAVGNECPDFEIKLYGHDGEGFTPAEQSFKLSENLGKITVINFWATWCTPCVQELPYFERLQKEYAEKLSVIAIHGTAVGEDVPAFINNKDDWKDYTLIFAQDLFFDVEKDGKTVNTDVYALLGGEGTWPMTLILDGEGRILFIKQGSLTYEALLEAVLPHVS